MSKKSLVFFLQLDYHEITPTLDSWLCAPTFQ